MQPYSLLQIQCIPRPCLTSPPTLQAPMGLSCSTLPHYTAGAGAPDQTSGVLAESLPVSWCQGGGVGPGRDRSYKSGATIHQVYPALYIV